jgi:hypothetical protein
VRVAQNYSPEEINMEAGQDYCDNVAVELDAWKSKFYDVLSRIDRLSSGDKAKMGDQINDLHIFAGELENRVERLRHECITDYKPDEIEMELKLTEKYIY